MCLAVSAEVIAIHANSSMATVLSRGIRRDISTTLVPDIAVGDHVMVHVGYAIQKLDANKAKERTRLLLGEGSPLASHAHA